MKRFVPLAHAISDSQFVFDVILFSRFCAEFFSDICHVDLKFLYTAAILVTPDFLDDRAVSQYFSGVSGQTGDNVILGLRQLYFRVVDKYTPRPIVYDKTVRDKDAVFSCPGMLHGCAKCAAYSGH